MYTVSLNGRPTGRPDGLTGCISAPLLRLRGTLPCPPLRIDTAQVHDLDKPRPVSLPASYPTISRQCEKPARDPGATIRWNTCPADADAAPEPGIAPCREECIDAPLPVLGRGHANGLRARTQPRSREMPSRRRVASRAAVVAGNSRTTLRRASRAASHCCSSWLQ